MDKDIHQPSARTGVVATLYLGADQPNQIYRFPARVTIDGDEYETFLRESVAPKFKGFTSYEALGYWEGKPERVRVLVIMGDDSHDLRTNVRWIAEQYKSRFNQDAVAYSFQACDYTLNCWPYGNVGKYHQLDKGTVDPCGDGHTLAEDRQFNADAADIALHGGDQLR